MEEALANGLTRRMLQSRRFVAIHRGIHAETDLERTLELLVAADLLVLPGDACLSHTTALHWYGVEVGAVWPRHYSINTSAQTRLDGIVLHRRLGLTAPLIAVDYARSRHLDGVVRARRSATLIRERVDSVRETDVRLTLVACRLPEPEVNVSIHDEAGEFLARGDLVYRRWKIVIEHDGWHHERNAAQRHHDILRRERLEAAGWRVIVIVSDDFTKPTAIVARVWEALVTAGYAGPAPAYDRSTIRKLRDL